MIGYVYTCQSAILLEVPSHGPCIFGLCRKHNTTQAGVKGMKVLVLSIHSNKYIQ